jgi:hypothetical protein
MADFFHVSIVHLRDDWLTFDQMHGLQHPMDGKLRFLNQHIHIVSKNRQIRCMAPKESMDFTSADGDKGH